MPRVEVVYALQDSQWLIEVNVDEQSTVADAIEAAKLEAHCPELAWREAKIGIFSQIVTLSHEVSDGDRIEIYRPLTIDPKLARRLRAQT